MFAWKQTSAKFAVQLWRNLEAISGWQFVAVHLCDFGGTHPVPRFTQHIFVIDVPDCLPGKVPNYVSYTQKALKCNIPMSLFGWVLQELNILPRADEQKVWLLCVTQLPHPSVLLVIRVESEVNVAVAFNGRSRFLDEYCLMVIKCLCEFNATYVID